MAKQESNKEDLLREATALVQRVELETDNKTVVVGFRRDGSVSLFFGSDPVFQFNSRAELRRAFVNDLLIKAVRNQLVQMRRQRSGGKVELLSSPLSDAQSRDLLERAHCDLIQLQKAIVLNQIRIVGQVTDGPDVLPRVLDWLADVLTTSIRIARVPNAR